MTTFLAQTKNGWIDFGTTFNEARFKDFAKKNPRKRLRIEVDDKTSYDMRKFFEGAVVPYFFYQHNAGIYKNFKDAREALKLEFNPVYVVDIHGHSKVTAGSTEKLTKPKFQQFLEKIQDYFMQNGYQFPDSEDYKRWKDTCPMIGELYPPLTLLINSFNETCKESKERAGFVSAGG